MQIYVFFAYLLIALFIYSWIRTDDMERVVSRRQKDLTREVLKNGPNTANVLFNHLWTDLCNAYDDGYSGCEDIIKRYKKIYEQVGIEFPSVFENIETRADFGKILETMYSR